MDVDRMLPPNMEYHALNMMICISAVIQSADLTMFTSVMKALEEHFEVNPTSLGMALLLQGIGHTLSAPIWGYFSDRYDRLQLLYVNMIGLSILCLLTAFSTSFFTLCAVRGLTGLLTGGMGPIAQTMLTSAVLPEERGKYFGWMVVCTQLGGIFGTVYGASMSHREVFEHQGWRFAFVSMAILTLTLGTSILAMKDNLTKMLRRSLTIIPTQEDIVSDFFTIMSKTSFKLLLLQGAFATTGAATMQFGLMIFQYVGFSDFKASTLVSCVQVGHAIGAFASGFLGDRCAELSPGHGRIGYGQAGNTMSVLILFSCMMVGNTLLSVDNYYTLAMVTFCLGFFQLWAYVGAVKPILSEIVPTRMAGQTLAYASAIDGAVASIAGAPVVGYIAQVGFGYQDTNKEVSKMDQDIRENNLYALSHAFICIAMTTWILQLLTFSLLHKTYKEDKEGAQEEWDERKKLSEGDTLSSVASSHRSMHGMLL